MPDGEGKRWRIEFYYDRRGRAPAQDFIRGLPDAVQGKVLSAIDKLEIYGPYLRMPEARHIRGKLWELRAGRGRVF